MKIEVIKFGGTSLKNREARQKAITLIKKHSQHHHVVVIVSAMGRYNDAYATDTLASLIHNFVSKKEQDRLLSIGEIISSIVLCDELLAENVQATSLSIQKAGIMTDDCYGRASVEFVKTDDLYKALKHYRVVVVPGFQGLSKEKEITTLGKGGSDYSAVILSRALQLKEATIYSDVCGIYTADPKLVDNVVLLDEISYEQAEEIARYKANVINEDAVMYAKKYHIDLILKSTFMNSLHTVIREKAQKKKCLCYAKGYCEVRFEKLLNIDDIKKSSFTLANDHYMFEKKELKNLKTDYSLLGEYTMLHFVGFENDLSKEISKISSVPFIVASNDQNTFFVLEKDTKNILNLWHDALILEEKNEFS